MVVAVRPREESIAHSGVLSHELSAAAEATNSVTVTCQSNAADRGFQQRASGPLMPKYPVYACPPDFALSNSRALIEPSTPDHYHRLIPGPADFSTSLCMTSNYPFYEYLQIVVLSNSRASIDPALSMMIID